MRICMVSDFFYPGSGGVETHIYELSQCLMARGHTVVVVTRAYGGRSGVRYMTNGLKVYYWPILAVYGVTLPTVLGTLPLMRCVLARERIDLVHGHAAFSSLAHECMLHAACLGVATVFTDHSLFGFADASAVLTNSLLALTLSTCCHCVCVSYTGKENTVLRAGVASAQISVIPNAIDPTVFSPAAAGHGKCRCRCDRPQSPRGSPVSRPSDTPPRGGGTTSCTQVTPPQNGRPSSLPSTSVKDREMAHSGELFIPVDCSAPIINDTSECTIAPDTLSAGHPPATDTADSPDHVPCGECPCVRRDCEHVTVVMVSRLVYRKGADLLAALLPLACRRLPHVRFVIGGDGDRRSLLEETVDRHGLIERVSLLGALPHEKVASVLAAGDIYLNCSLTEAFCIALLEAASCGLLVVSTRVGGVAEVLPRNMRILSEPSAAALCSALVRAVSLLQRQTRADRWRNHRRLARNYSWHNVAARTERVYRGILGAGAERALSGRGQSVVRVRRSVARCGVFAVLLLALLHVYQLLLLLLDWWLPLEAIDVAADCRVLHSRLDARAEDDDSDGEELQPGSSHYCRKQH